MKQKTFSLTKIALLLLLVGAGSINQTLANDDLLQKAQQIFAPLPQDMATKAYPLSPEKIELGRKLFFDPRLSLDGTVSCSTCHLPQFYGTDALQKSIGVAQRPNHRNAPTVLNAALYPIQVHWIGDRESIEAQAQGSLTGKNSMGNPDTETVIKKLNHLGYANAFKKAFPKEEKPITPKNWGVAIGAFERTLTTPSPFDRYLEGDENALDAKAKAGLKVFMETGCIACHNGVGLGGGSFQKFGVFGEYWHETKSQEIDQGRFAFTGKENDRYVFKVPSLRNVAMTPPYFHDGSVEELEKAIRIMAKLQLNKELDQQTIASIIAFLNSLTGKVPDTLQTPPVLPPKAFNP
jgi:cytochrome c peroxidase